MMPGMVGLIFTCVNSGHAARPAGTREILKAGMADSLTDVPYSYAVETDLSLVSPSAEPESDEGIRSRSRYACSGMDVELHYGR